MYTCTDISDSQISGLFHSLIVPHVLLLSPSTEKCLNTCAVGTFGQLGVGDRSPQILAYVLTVNPIRTGEGALIPPPFGFSDLPMAWNARVHGQVIYVAPFER